MVAVSVARALRLPAPGTETFFLWGPRQVGKSTLLRATHPDAIWIDLLKADEFRRYTTAPERLREELLAISPERRPSQIVIDEVQKVPALLDEVHWLHEHLGLQFALCGSSARKLRHEGVNLLGGRATRYELGGFTSGELGDAFDLERAVNHGWLPRICASERPQRLLDAYVGDYLQHEIAAEGLVRRLPSYTRRPKRRVIQAPKFYFDDVGVVNHLARRGRMEPGGELFGKARCEVVAGDHRDPSEAPPPARRRPTGASANDRLSRVEASRDQ